MIIPQEKVTMDIDILQREYRNMELNRKAFAEESNLVSLLLSIMIIFTFAEGIYLIAIANRS